MIILIFGPNWNQSTNSYLISQILSKRLWKTNTGPIERRYTVVKTQKKISFLFLNSHRFSLIKRIASDYRVFHRKCEDSFENSIDSG